MGKTHEVYKCGGRGAKGRQEKHLERSPISSLARPLTRTPERQPASAEGVPGCALLAAPRRLPAAAHRTAPPHTPAPRRCRGAGGSQHRAPASGPACPQTPSLTHGLSPPSLKSEERALGCRARLRPALCLLANTPPGRGDRTIVQRLRSPHSLASVTRGEK